MNIALLLSNKRIDGSDTDMMPIIVLRIDDKKVVEVEKETFVKKNINHLLLWSLTKHIKEIYVQDIDPMIKSLFERLGIAVRKYADIDKNPLLREFVKG